MLIGFKKVRRRSLIAGTTAVAIFAGGGIAAAASFSVSPFATNNVGTLANGSVQLPDNQIVAPYGQRIELGGESVGTAISPDGTKVAVQANDASGDAEDQVQEGVPLKAGLISSLDILDASTGKVLQSFGGVGVVPPVYSPDGTALYAATAGGTNDPGVAESVLKYTVNPSTAWSRIRPRP